MSFVDDDECTYKQHHTYRQVAPFLPTIHNSKKAVFGQVATLLIALVIIAFRYAFFPRL
jgi:hypothetical protein